jgi:hypothetical protein
MAYMQLAKIRLPDGQTGAALVRENGVTPLREAGRLIPLATLLEAVDARAMIQSLTTGVRVETVPLESVELVAPIDEQEVWAAGVT